MGKSGLDTFGELLVKELRDPAITFIDYLVVEGHYRAKPLKRLSSRVAALTDAQRGLLRQCVILALDCGIDAFLQAIQRAEESGAPIAIGGQDLKTPGLALDDKLNRWIKKFSKFPDRSG